MASPDFFHRKDRTVFDDQTASLHLRVKQASSTMLSRKANKTQSTGDYGILRNWQNQREIRKESLILGWSFSTFCLIVISHEYLIYRLEVEFEEMVASLSP